MNTIWKDDKEEACRVEGCVAVSKILRTIEGARYYEEINQELYTVIV